MIEKNATLIFGFISFTLYLSIVGVLIFYFNFHHSTKIEHYVIKNTPHKKQQAINVSLVHLKALPKKKHRKKQRVTKQKRSKKIIKKQTDKIKKNHKVKKILKAKKKRQIIKKKVRKKIKPIKTVTQKKVKAPRTTKSLFSTLSAKQAIVKKKKIVSTSSLFSRLTPAKKSPLKVENGIENSYLQKIEQRLKGWPAQSDYVGEKAKVWLKIKANGFFEFKVISASGNQKFNEGLTNYLKELQKFGFGKHKGKRAYEINVEFVATQ